MLKAKHIQHYKKNVYQLVAQTENITTSKLKNVYALKPNLLKMLTEFVSAVYFQVFLIKLPKDANNVQQIQYMI